MPTCARCGDSTDETKASSYNYCEDCYNLFQRIREEGVFVRSRHGNREFGRYPYVGPSPPGKNQDPQNQVEALAGALAEMEKRDCRGVFHYQKTGSWWFVDEYLEAHPGIAEDVESYRERSNSIFGRFF